ncbi:ABC transporter substrate-binding protein [Streptomyces agglomeratus]|uniref:ABC transporter substrate-binding protein n=1 Tax=Streptomyces agglomeratus TaxID=285458 RepID=UPI0008546F9B|nr:ABC transporter substrate-binding protein [Streptomyces agglomeratus]OEJ41797.1 ABC transporter substrate-binding protein [Streptomyces agglomeratus]OEJ43825.1 ABC transporter substrate-binding protein [Streptomyces agglomeratus]
MSRTAKGHRARTIRTLAAGAAATGLFVATGCSSGDDGPGEAAGGVPVVEKGKLTTCTHLPYPPFQSEQGGEVVGFDVALVDLVAKNLKVEQEILDTPFENFKTGAFLNSGECDLAAAGMTITDERKKNVDFSVPYFDATQALLASKKSGVTTLDEVKSGKKKLGAQAETTGESYAKSQGFDPVAFESSDAVLNGLRTGQVDAVVIDYPVVQGWLKDKANADQFVLGQNIETGEQYGFSVKKGNTKLKAAIDKAITDAKADGTYKKLYEQWIGPMPKAQS